MDRLATARPRPSWAADAQQTSYGARSSPLVLPNAGVKFSRATADSVGGLGNHLNHLDVAETSAKNPLREGMYPDIRLDCVNA